MVQQFIPSGPKKYRNLDFNLHVSLFIFLNTYRNFVPISLLVTIELVKTFQAIFITWDTSMYDQEQDMPAGVQSSNLNEELG